MLSPRNPGAPGLQPGKTKQARMWVYVGDEDNPYNVFDFTISRSRDGPAKFLEEFDQVIVADAYGGYDGICLEGGITQAGCWARRPSSFGELATPVNPSAIRHLKTGF